MAKISYSTVCDRGLVRQINQDSIFADSDGCNGVFCVADGMGGHTNGELASAAIVSEVKKTWGKLDLSGRKYAFRDVFGCFEHAIDLANKEIYEHYNMDSICGSTVSLLFIYDSCYGVLNIGDSRIYTFQKKKIIQATEDDVWENLPEQSGIDRNVLSQYPQYGKLTNSVGTFERLIKKYSINQITGKISFLICSDGLYKYCDEERINDAINRYRNNPDDVVNYLSNEVYQNGASDNFSIIFVDV